MRKQKLPREMQTRCSFGMTTIDLTTGERRELSQEEIAAQLEKMLAIPLDERMRISLRRAGYEPQSNEEAKKGQ